jgi:hypothetical protein
MYCEAITFFAVLIVLHVLEPEFNLSRVRSEYQLGDYGFLMLPAFWGLACNARIALRRKSSRTPTPHRLDNYHCARRTKNSDE